MQKESTFRARLWVACALHCAATFGIVHPVAADQVSLPLVNGGFEDGPLGQVPVGWRSTSTYPSGPNGEAKAEALVVYQHPYNLANQYMVALAAGYYGEGGMSSISQTVTIPNENDVRWSFWVGDFFGAIPENGTSLNWFSAMISGGGLSEQFRIMINDHTFEASCPAGWTCEALPNGYWVTSGNLAEVFGAGTEVNVSYSQAYALLPAGGVLASVDDRRPVPEAAATFPLLMLGAFGTRWFRQQIRRAERVHLQ